MTIASRHTCEAHTPLSRARSGGWRYIGLSKFQIDGIVPVIPTPFDADEEIDWAALRSLLDFAAGAGVGRVWLPAYASEFYKPTEAGRREAIVVPIYHARGKTTVIAKANYPSTLPTDSPV